jgi:hypothetical protein
MERINAMRMLSGYCDGGYKAGEDFFLIIAGAFKY